MTHFIKTGLAAILLSATSSAALAQGFWTGTWDTTYGELKLKQDGNYVYGDYGTWGEIEGVLVSTARGQVLRARYTRNDDGTSGYMEWIESGDDGNRYTGRWVRESARVPAWFDQSRTRWRGTRIDDETPTLSVYDGAARIGAFVSATPAKYRDWIGAADMNASDPWTGTWDTDYGPVRLKTFASRYVYGDYGSHGSIWGVTSKVGNDHILRARYKRNDDGSEGFIEWKSDGKADHTVDGRWSKITQTPPVWNASGGVWNATRTNAAVPALGTFQGSYGAQAVLGTNPTFKTWTEFRKPKPKPKPKPKLTNLAGNSTHLDDPLRRKFKALEDTPASFTPRYVEVDLGTMKISNGYWESVSQTEYISEFYGLIGIYLHCETPSGSRSIKPFGGAANNVVDIPRKSARKVNPHPGYTFDTNAKRRFPIDAACLSTPDSRFKVQFQTNLKERDLVPAADDKWGYRAGVAYLDEHDNGSESSANQNGVRHFTSDGESYFSYEESKNNAVTSANDRFFRINAGLTFIE